ncbi:hypothetical protein [Crocosphaera chwakensis]|uniref:Uncharacterized protein n=1 Tax=Crocosphaera chwakensis CCY0110 TaxID=391612 RepID=A3IZ42_9CHRO|nr:hypothetical protein [Crocosphaera chwakensis]EAZ88246.1 hypothetical protein CY0110_14455 [Crocosphaera chwakensis CCY0110]
MNKINQESAKSVNSEASQLLLNMFHELSEDIYCAGWSANIEFYLWEITLETDKNTSTFLRENLKDYQIKELSRLSNLCQGWWVWKDPQGETFVSLDEMGQLYKNWKNFRPKVTPIIEDDPENSNGIMYKLRQIKL